ncbi:Alpha-1,6-mannosylglycoprotein 6-beta-N-acetylglucosaminyltransferase A [Channa argus]|uniref:alpha-1,6-mannosyl-glycoprotein 6-beta-N-acetylglucosaminyltransferase n=1 Tax=Channa argus TaxID=215402 RepID=A0A6G1PY79_CHAAH|nr:Alpha-1,6-mannosylglycoprotein 6-beta-N-acetylglucosaminyltransferase A [Channa argus]
MGIEQPDTRLRQDDAVWVKTSRAKVSSPPLLRDYKVELQALQIKMEAEEKKEQMRDEMIKELQSDKVHLQQQVGHLEELLKLKAENHAEADDKVKGEEHCPLPLMDGYPKCEGKLKEGPEQAVVRISLKGLYPSLENQTQFRWIHQRIQSMEEIWVEAGQTLSAKYNLTARKAKQILVHPGVVTDESHLKIAQTAFTGGPLGELVQWSDLISALYILGHHLHLSASIPSLKHFLGIKTDSCPPHRHSKVEANLIYTDIIGLKQIQTVLQTSWIKYKQIQENDLKNVIIVIVMSLTKICIILLWAAHTPDNTFLGFVVQQQLSYENTERLKSTKRQNQALVYGKRAKFWEGKEDYLDVIHKHLEIHGTVDDSARIPSYVKNHGIIRGTEIQTLLRQSKVFVGLSFPYEGPAPLEALANGCVFLNPRLNPPQSSLNSQFFKGKPNIREVTSQHPYAEAIGEPYVWIVDMHNSTDVDRALTAILSQSEFCYITGRWPPVSSLQVVEAEAGTSCKQACQKVGLICEPAFFQNLNSAEKLANHSVKCQTSEFSDSHMVLPAYNKIGKHCLFQSDPLLFSCVRSDESLIRVCPCRDYIKDQIALCKACV